MNDSLYREKSMENLKAPDQLSGYLRVTGPGVWFVLIGLIVLLGGLLLWSMFGTITTTIDVPALVRGGSAAVYVLGEDASFEEGALAGNMVPVAIGDVELSADPKNCETVTLDASEDPALYESGYLSPGKTAVVLTSKTSLKDGYYTAAVTVETLRPISLLFSSNG